MRTASSGRTDKEFESPWIFRGLSVLSDVRASGRNSWRISFAPRGRVLISAVVSGDSGEGDDVKRYYGPRRRFIGGRALRHFYCLEYDTDTKRRRWVSTYQTSLKCARRWIEARRQEAAGALYAPVQAPAPDRSFGAVAREWLESLAALRPDTRCMAAGAVRSWAPMAQIPLRSLRQAQLDEWISRAHSGHAPGTYNKAIRLLSWFLSWARRRGYLAATFTFLPRKNPRRIPRVLSDSEEHSLFAQCSDLLRTLLIVAVDTGLRRRALLYLCWEHLDLDHGKLQLPAEAMKSNREFISFLSDRAIEALKSTRQAVSGPVFPFNRESLRLAFRAACKKAGIQGLHFHDLRKTFCSRLRKAGVPLEVTMALSDHHDLKTMLNIYRQVDEAELKTAVQATKITPKEVSDG